MQSARKLSSEDNTAGTQKSWCSGMYHDCLLQARSMSSKTANIARLGNIIAGVCLIGIAVPYGLLASLVRKHYGPDSAVSMWTRAV